MKTKDLITIGATALVTTTLTIATFLPNSIEAGGDSGALTPKIAQPKLAANGVEITLAAADQQSLKAGDEPAFELKAINTAGQPTEVAVRILMTSISAGGALSRILPRPQNLWQERCVLTLKANETKTVALAPQTKLPANSTINMVLQPAGADAIAAAGNSQAAQTRLGPGLDPSAIVALRFSTVPTPTQQVLVAAR